MGSFKSGNSIISGGLTVSGPFTGQLPSVTTFTGNNTGATIPITNIVANVDAGGSPRTGMRFAGGGTAGQIIVVINTGGESIAFDSSDATCLVLGMNTNKDTIRTLEAHVFVSNGTYWCHVGGGATDEEMTA